MCGIVGVIGHSTRDVVEDMSFAIRHRGPDSHGYVQKGAAHVGVRRLSIIDLEHGEQPLSTADGKLTIVLNGEIYNYLDLQHALKARGHVFRTESDTEVALVLFKEYGTAAFAMLRGMFACAISDGSTTYLVRDQWGIKPLYYARLGRGIVFGSEIKAIVQHPDFVPALDVQSLVELCHFGSVFDSASLISGITSVRPGSYLCVTEADGTTTFTERSYVKNGTQSEIHSHDAIHTLSVLFRDSIDRHLQGADRFGIALSGGIDSSILAALVPEDRRSGAIAYTIADDPNSFEIQSASALARELGYRHEVNIPSYETYCDALPSFIWHIERCIPQGIALFLLARTMSASGKVCLAGEGADEIFFGYRSHLAPEKYLARLMQNAANVARTGIPLRPIVHDTITHLQSTDTAHSHRAVANFLMHDPLVYGHLNVLDSGAMASGIEMRVPYLDGPIVAYAQQLPLSVLTGEEHDITKLVLRRFARSLNYSALSALSKGRPKTGLPDATARLRARFVDTCGNLPDSYALSHRYRAYMPESSGPEMKSMLVLIDLFERIFIDERARSPDHVRLPDILQDATRS